MIELFEGMLWCEFPKECGWSTGLCGIWTYIYIRSFSLALSHTVLAALHSSFGQVWFHQGGQKGFLGQPHRGLVLKMAAMVTLKAKPGLLNMHRKEPRAPLREGSWVDWVRGKPGFLIASTWDIEGFVPTQPGVMRGVGVWVCVCLNSNIPVLSAWLN